MFKAQGGKFSSVFGTSKDKRNQVLNSFGLLQLIIVAQNNFQSNY